MSSREPLRFLRGLEAGVTNPPPPRSPRLVRGRFDLVELADVLIAIICFATTASALNGQNASHGSPFSALALLSASRSSSACRWSRAPASPRWPGPAPRWP